jgi:hypothetical protein
MLKFQAFLKRGTTSSTGAKSIVASFSEVAEIEILQLFS